LLPLNDFWLLNDPPRLIGDVLPLEPPHSCSTRAFKLEPPLLPPNDPPKKSGYLPFFEPEGEKLRIPAFDDPLPKLLDF